MPPSVKSRLYPRNGPFVSNPCQMELCPPLSLVKIISVFSAKPDGEINGQRRKNVKEQQQRDAQSLDAGSQKSLRAFVFIGGVGKKSRDEKKQAHKKGLV